MWLRIVTSFLRFNGDKHVIIQFILRYRRPDRSSSTELLLHRAIYTFVALLDYAPVVARESIEVIAQEGDIDLFFSGRRSQEAIRLIAINSGEALPCTRYCGIGEDIIHKGGGTEIERERHVWAILNGLAEIPDRRADSGRCRIR